jgi:hypothetical protein
MWQEITNENRMYTFVSGGRAPTRLPAADETGAAEAGMDAS